jgi:hypothetical protein
MWGPPEDAAHHLQGNILSEVGDQQMEGRKAAQIVLLYTRTEVGRMLWSRLLVCNVGYSDYGTKTRNAVAHSDYLDLYNPWRSLLA